MATYCKGVCCREEESAFKLGFGKANVYRNGVKYCRTCSRYMKLNSIQCPCCKNMTKSKSRRYKRKLTVTHCDKYPKVPIVAV
jgi:hypothetical protein